MERAEYTGISKVSELTFDREFPFSSQQTHTIPPSRDSIALFFFGWVQGFGKGLWDVYGPFHVRAHYASGADMFIREMCPTGIKFIGEDGWIWVTRGQPVTLSDPAVAKSGSPALDASDRKMLAAGIKENEIHLHYSPNNDHHLDWLTSIKTRQPPAAPAEVGHRFCTACLLAHDAMKLNRELK